MRSLAAGICGSDLHALADFSHFTGLMDRVGVPMLDPEADCVFGHEFCAEIVEHGPDTEATLPVGSRVCSVPIIVGPTGVEQIGYSNQYPGALAEHMVLQEMLLVPVPDELESDLAALTEPLAVGERAVGGRPAAGTAVPRRGLRPGGPRGHRRPQGRGRGPCWPPTSRRPRRRLAEAFGADEVIDPAVESPHERWAAFGVAKTVMERAGAAMLGGTVTDPVISRRSACPACCSRSSPTRPTGAGSWSWACACTPTPSSRSWR